MQREELKLQRPELTETRKELAKSAMMQEELVKITKAGYDLQKHLRKSDLWLELSLVSSSIAQSASIRAPHKRVTEFTLTPKHSALRLRGATITTKGKASLNDKLLNKQNGKIISEDESITIQFFHEGRDDLNSVAIYLASLPQRQNSKDDLECR